MFQIFAIFAGLITVYLIYQAIKPLIDTTDVTADTLQQVEDESMALLSRRDRLVEELRELEFEAALNKIDARDLKALKARFELEAMDVYERLDQASEAYQARIDAEVDARIKGPAAKPSAPARPSAEAAVTAADEPVVPEVDPRRSSEERTTEKAPGGPEEKPEEEMVDCWSCGELRAADGEFCDQCGKPAQPPQTHQCPACGHDNRPGAKFCKRCGTGLQVVEASA